MTDLISEKVSAIVDSKLLDPNFAADNLKNIDSIFD